MAPKALLVWADGIGTKMLDPKSVDSILRQVVDDLGDSLIENGILAVDVKVPWKASMAMIGGTTSWENAAYEGMLMVDDIINKHADRDTLIILLGYSGGCKVIHDWLDTRSVSVHRIAAVGFLSDPFRPHAKWQSGTLNPGGFGICGELETPIMDRTFWTSYFEDIISSCPANSPLRTLADLSDKIPGSFVEDFVRHARLGNWQLATYIGMWRKDPLGYFRDLGPRLDAARIGVEKYLTGAHTKAYAKPYVTSESDRSLATRLAHTISYKVRKDLKEKL